uniref:Telomerase RNA component interacting RNase n=1 Tax=Cuerna arida TaxID=1464854 RepID=A0A1B6ESZ2_9HEMI
MVYHRSSGGSSSSKRPVNAFANDGSFLEMFKKMQEQQAQGSSDPGVAGNSKSEEPSSSIEPKEGTAVSDIKDSSTSSDTKPASSNKPFFVGKRRGGRFLATGKVKKLKPEGQEEEEAPPKDAWSLYLAEVKKYKQTTCEEEGKTRPLVK